MNTRTILLLAILFAVCGSGCRRRPAASNSPPASTEEGSGNPLTSEIGKNPAQGDVRRGVEKQIDQNALRQIAACYISCKDSIGHTPANVDELLAEMKGYPGQYIQMIKDGWLVMVPNAPLTSDSVILYEKNVYQKWNNRVVAFGDGSVRTMDETAFQAALKAGGK